MGALASPLRSTSTVPPLRLPSCPPPLQVYVNRAPLAWMGNLVLGINPGSSALDQLHAFSFVNNLSSGDTAWQMVRGGTSTALRPLHSNFSSKPALLFPAPPRPALPCPVPSRSPPLLLCARQVLNASLPTSPFRTEHFSPNNSYRWQQAGYDTAFTEPLLTLQVAGGCPLTRGLGTRGAPLLGV